MKKKVKSRSISPKPKPRGRPKKDPSEKQSGKITAYVMVGQKKRLEAVARRKKMTLSQWVAETMLRELKKVKDRRKRVA